jgi:hypothetical protein
MVGRMRDEKQKSADCSRAFEEPEKHQDTRRRSLFKGRSFLPTKFAVS